MLRYLRSWLPLALIALLGLWLRIHDLAARPMHADEANQAVKLGELLDTGRYAFDPADHHGPTLYYAALPLAWLRGEHSLAALDETTVRLVPALGGTLAVVLLYLLAVGTGASPLLALAAAALLAVSPPAVYYSRYFIQETLLGTFALLAFAAGQAWWRSGRLGWALAAGGALGLMQATKASAPLFIVAAAAALWAVQVARPAARRWRRDALLGIVAALFVAALFYSSFGTHLAGLRDAFATYAAASHRALETSAHAKPWWYYFALFGWSTNGGLTFSQLAFSALALCGVGFALLRPDRLLRGAALYTAIVVTVLSVTPYKTPWHTVHLVPGLALLAAGALTHFPRRWLAWLLFALVATTQVAQTRLTCFLRPADPRNPYAYVHSSPDVLKFRALVDHALDHDPTALVRVISEEYWPLPWYFRGLERIGYWTSPPADCDGAVVIASSSLAEAVQARLHGEYRATLLGLRPGFVCVVYTPVR